MAGGLCIKKIDQNLIFQLYIAYYVLVHNMRYLAEKWGLSKSSQINGTRPVFYAKEDPVKIKIQKNLILEIITVENGIFWKIKLKNNISILMYIIDCDRFWALFIFLKLSPGFRNEELYTLVPISLVHLRTSRKDDPKCIYALLLSVHRVSPITWSQQPISVQYYLHVKCSVPFSEQY